MNPIRAGIFGVAGTKISESEKQFFSALNPLGFILFARNCESPMQVQSLVRELKSLCNHESPLVLIDQEGGRVARLKPPYWRAAPAAKYFADLARTSLPQAKELTYANARLIAEELYGLGINVDCAPLADIPVTGSHNIIGDRAYGETPEQVSDLAREMARGLLDGGVLPVLKHIPGHGRARADSHEELPTVDATLEELQRSDFIPFQALRDLPLGMTAHILYTALDANLPATLSPTVLRFIRNEIGFEGLLMSDDLSMKALKGDLGIITQQSLIAGCDIVLHCNGKMEEMEAIAARLPELTEASEERFMNAASLLAQPKPYDYAKAQQQLQTPEVA